MSHRSLSSDGLKAIKILDLGKKAFHLRPECLVRYLRSLPLTEIAREVFWWHWGEGYKLQSLTTQLSVSEVAEALQVSTSTVSRAYEQLINVGLIRRQIPRAAHGGYGTARTTIDIPDQTLMAMQDHADRQNIAQPSQDTHMDCTDADSAVQAVNIKQSASETNATQTPERVAANDKQAQIERLNQIIAEGNQKALQCAETNDLPGLHAANWQVAQAQASKRELLTPPRSIKPSRHSTAPRDERVQADDPPAQPYRQLSPRWQQQIADRVAGIARVSAPQALTQEIIFSIAQGAQAKKPVPLAVNAAIKLVQENRWRTPYGFDTKIAPYPDQRDRGYPDNRRAL